MPIAEVNGIEIYYEIKGEGIPLALICGFTASSETWEKEFLEALSKHHELLLFDNRGTGRSTKPAEEYSIKTMADDLAGLMDEINLTKANVMGGSMGGTIAQEFALNYPDKVMKLILGCTTVGGRKFVASKEIFELLQNLSHGIFPDMSREQYVDYFMELIYSPKFLKKNKENILERLINNKHPSPAETWVKHAQAVVNFDTVDRVGEIRKPTLILHGDEDDFIAPYNSMILHRRIADSKLVTFSNAGHVFHVEAREQVVKIMLDYLSE
jgi:pimeloyl-ACP methyl ester carboxylesterase